MYNGYMYSTQTCNLFLHKCYCPPILVCPSSLPLPPPPLSLSLSLSPFTMYLLLSLIYQFSLFTYTEMLNIILTVDI